MSDLAVDSVTAAVRMYSAAIDAGALLSIDESGARVRLLPLKPQ